MRISQKHAEAQPVVAHPHGQPPNLRPPPPRLATAATFPMAKRNGEEAPVTPPPRGAGYATSIVSARSQSPLLSRTSSRIEVMRRERTSRPVGDRRLRPPRRTFS